MNKQRANWSYMDSPATAYACPNCGSIDYQDPFLAGTEGIG